MALPLVGLGGGGTRVAIGSQTAPDALENGFDGADRQVAMNRGRLLLSFGGGLGHRFGEEPGVLSLGAQAE